MRELDPRATTGTRPRAVRGCREVPGLGGDRAQEVVRHAAAVSEGHLVGGDVQARVQLYLVGVHNLAAQRDGHVDRQLRLAGPRGTDDHHQPRRRVRARATAAAAPAVASSPSVLHPEPPRQLPWRDRSDGRHR
jgi:hypothetical protein